jgi:tetratricopeptide (TPR) repeat protein
VLALKAMHREPGRRYATVEALARDIDHYFKGEPLEGRPDEVSYRIGKFVRRNRRPLAGAGLAMGALATVVIFYTARLKSARDDALADEARVVRIQQFTRGLFDSGEKDYAPNKDLRVIKLVDRGLAQARDFDGDPAVQSDLYATLGSIYQRLGDTRQADWLLRAALDKRRSLYGRNAAVVIDSEIDLARLRDFQEELGEAERLTRDALAAAQALRPPDQRTVASAFASLGRVLEDSGKYPAAEPPLREAVRIYTDVAPGTAELAGSVTELANVKFYESDYDASWTLNQQALALDRKIHGEHHPTYSSDLFNLGAIKDQRGDYAAAEAYYRQGLEITKDWFEPGHPQVASDTTMLARVLSKQGRYDEARALLEQALAIQERVHGPDHAAVASALNELGVIARNAKRYDDAERAFTRIQGIYRKKFPDGHYLQGLASSNLASVALARGDYPRAEAGFREALRIYATKLSPDHDNVGITRARLGRTLLAERRFDEARAESLAAYEIFEKKKLASSTQWLQMAREDLVAEYEGLGQPALGRRYKEELAVNQK